jgi:purine-binding chemotaxis protein CheW
MTNQEKAAAPLSESMVKNKDTAQFVGFQLADQRYAFRIEQIQEIVIPDQVTRIPQVMEYVEGVSNLRGTIIPIINLRKLFGIDPKPNDDESRTIVVNVGDRTMGCTVDSVSQVMRIPAESIQSAPDIVASEGTAYVQGFAKLDGQLIILLDIDELLEPEKLEAVHQAARQDAGTSEPTNDNTAVP